MVTWEELEARCRQCQNCPLSETRTNVVFGVGNRQADILFIGEGPGEQEDLQGESIPGICHAVAITTEKGGAS